MGLDMFLKGHVYFWCDDLEKPKNLIDGFKLCELVVELGYWRKHPDLHGYIVQNFCNGVDDCRSVELSLGDLNRILEAVKSDSLPKTDGFFFGESNERDKELSIEILDKTIEWIGKAKPKTSRFAAYVASW